MPEIRSLCVFCGSSTGTEPAPVAAAVELGATLARSGIRLVYGGGAVGLMGTVADACMAAGGEVVGVIPVGLFSKEVGHVGLTELIEVGSMHERKQRMYELADGFVALPGGLGTLEEFAEVLTWSQLGLHAKPTGLLDTVGYYAHFLAFLDHAVDEGFVRPADRSLVLSGTEPATLLERMRAWQPASDQRWEPVDRP